MRPPMPPMRPPMMEQMRPPVDQFRPPMRPMMEQPPRPIVQRIIAIRQNFEPVSQSLEQQRNEEADQRPQMMFVPQQVSLERQKRRFC